MDSKHYDARDFIPALYPRPSDGSGSRRRVRELEVFSDEGRMVRCLLLLALLLTQLSTFNPQLHAATVTWIGGSGDWNTPANWSTGALPGPSDDVVLDVPGDMTITHSSGTHAVNSIQSQERFTLSGGTLTVSAASLLVSNVTVGGGTLSGSGDSTISGTLTWTGGTMSGSGQTIIAPGATLNLSGTGTKIVLQAEHRRVRTDFIEQVLHGRRVSPC
jgi:phage baseplate assembly protein gpV